MKLDRRLAGKTVVITGGGSGIGKGAAQRISAEGADVAILDVRLPLAVEVAEELKAAGGNAMAIECDVSDESQVAAAMATTVERFGGIGGLFANAGTAGLGWLHETTYEDWRSVLGVNLDGVFFCCKHTIPSMLERGGGSIVVTSSIAGSVAGGGGANVSYSVSKAGVIALARQIAVDYGDQGIRANAIQPGPVAGSNMGRHVAEDHADASTPAVRMKRPKPWIPLRKAGDSRDELGATVAFLLSDDAGYITGTQLPVDGGYLAT